MKSMTPHQGIFSVGVATLPATPPYQLASRIVSRNTEIQEQGLGAEPVFVQDGKKISVTGD